MNHYLLILVIVCYLLFLFGIAYWAEKNAKKKWVDNSYVYVLSLAVYCSAWTYYGSVGVAATTGVGFLTTYLGPVIASPLWIFIMRKVIRITKQHKISSIADFISLRYGNNRSLGALVTLICLIAVVPYISLQLKAVSESFDILRTTEKQEVSILNDTTFYVAVLLAVFVAFFGTRTIDATRRRQGIIFSVAIESILKLSFFLIIGIYVTFYLFDGTQDIYNQIAEASYFTSLTTLESFEAGFNWSFMIILSFFAIFLLPRQFQVAVVENKSDRHLKKAIWIFPLYLLLFNLFVIFIAWGGKITFGETVNPDYYTLWLPIQNNNLFLAILVFLGGFSAIISMVVVSTLALSIMLSNNIIIPYGFLDKFIANRPDKNSNYIKNIRRISIFSLIIFAYLFYVNFNKELSLFSIGQMSFVIIAQLAPSFFIGLFWNRGSALASKLGMAIGMIVVFFTLIFPYSYQVFWDQAEFIEAGYFGLSFLKPYQLFGLQHVNPVVNSFFWSLFLNTMLYLYISLSRKGNYRERNYAEMFVNASYENMEESAFVWKGEAYVEDIKNVLKKFLGEERTKRALRIFHEKYHIPEHIEKADARLINFSEKLLTGRIGSASSRILIDSVVKEQPVSLVEVLEILEESKQTILNNKLLKQRSEELSKLTVELKKANEELVLQDKMKDDFLDTVSHELKTPVTSIKAASEVLLDEQDDMPVNLRSQFLKNIVSDSNRLASLIHSILDLEKLSSGTTVFNYKPSSIKYTIGKAIQGTKAFADQKSVKINTQYPSEDLIISYDRDRVLQVFVNLLTNAIKFVPENTGLIHIEAKSKKDKLIISVEDNGKGVSKEDAAYIFEKFYQSKTQNIKKPLGSGLGLSISKKIIEAHQGKLYLDKRYHKGAKFFIELPKYLTQNSHKV